MHFPVHFEKILPVIKQKHCVQKQILKHAPSNITQANDMGRYLFSEHILRKMQPSDKRPLYIFYGIIST